MYSELWTIVEEYAWDHRELITVIAYLVERGSEGIFPGEEFTDYHLKTYLEKASYNTALSSRLYYVQTTMSRVVCERLCEYEYREVLGKFCNIGRRTKREWGLLAPINVMAHIANRGREKVIIGRIIKHGL
jgi:hypothetical protein